jgi:AAA domain-containing protein
VNRDLVFAFDEVDRIMGRAYQTDFFALLRAWHNRRAIHPEWEKLGLALVISTETHLLIKNADQSPFNVAVKVELDELTLEQCADLNSRYPNPLAAVDLDDIFELLGGHPFLTRLAFHRLAARQFELQTLHERAAAPHGPFGDHLRALHARLSEDPALIQCLRQVIRHGTGNQTEIDRLSSAGIVKQANNRYRPANLLYAHFFGNAR